jgi:hypothetical protein
MNVGRVIFALIAAPLQLTKVVGRRSDFPDGQKRSSNAPERETWEILHEIVRARARTNEILARFLVDDWLTLPAKHASAVANIFGGELKRLTTAPQQTNEVVAELIEGLGQVSQAAARAPQDRHRVEKILEAQERTHKLLEPALDTCSGADAEPPLVSWRAKDRGPRDALTP